MNFLLFSMIKKRGRCIFCSVQYVFVNVFFHYKSLIFLCLKESRKYRYLSLHFWVFYFTNREPSIVLCSVVKHGGSSQSTKEVQGKYETQFSVKPSMFTICNSVQTGIVWLVEFNTFVRIFSVFNIDSESKMFGEIRSNCG